MTNEQRIEPMLAHFGVTLEQIKAPTRKRHITICRHYCMIILRRTTPMTLEAISQWFGGRDHTTVMKAADNVRAFECDWRHKYNYKVFEDIVNEIRDYVDPMPESIGYDEMYLNLVILEP